MTNGEKLCIDFPNMRYTISSEHGVVTTIDVAASFDLDWWNAEYKESTKDDLGVVCISKEDAIKTIQKYGVGCFDSDDFVPEYCERFIIAKLNELSPVTPQKPILDKIRTEIEKEIIPRNSDQYDHEAMWQNMGLRMALKVIDKYKEPTGGMI